MHHSNLSEFIGQTGIKTALRVRRRNTTERGAWTLSDHFLINEPRMSFPRGLLSQVYIKTTISWTAAGTP